MSDIVVNENARLELLRGLASVRDWAAAERPAMREELRSSGVNDALIEQVLNDWYPLFAGDFQNSREDVMLAARECAGIGHIEMTQAGMHAVDIRFEGAMIRLTDAGYDWIRAHDALGEAAQEASRV